MEGENVFNENTYLVENLKQRINEIIEENILQAFQCVENYANYYESDNVFLRNLDGYTIRQIINRYFNQDLLAANVDTIISNVFYDLETDLLKSAKTLDDTTRVNVLTDYAIQSISDELNRVVEHGLNAFEYDFIYDLKFDHFYDVPEEIEYLGGFNDDLLDFKQRLYNRMLYEFDESRGYIIRASSSLVGNTLDDYIKNLESNKEKYRDDKIEKEYRSLKQRNMGFYREYQSVFDNDKILSEYFHRSMKICDDLIEKKGMDDSWISEHEKSHRNLTDLIARRFMTLLEEEKQNDSVKSTKEDQKDDGTKQSKLPINERISEHLDNDSRQDSLEEYNKVYQESMERKKKFELADENSQSIFEQQKKEKVEVQIEMTKEQPIHQISAESDNTVQTYDNQPKKVIEDSEVQQQLVQAFKSVQSQKENTQQNTGKSSADIDIDLDDFAKQEKQILNAKHFNDEQKKRMIQELYDEFDSYVEENPEYHRTR